MSDDTLYSVRVNEYLVEVFPEDNRNGIPLSHILVITNQTKGYSTELTFDTKMSARLALYHGADQFHKDISLASFLNHYSQVLRGAFDADSRIEEFVPRKISKRNGLSEVLMRDDFVEVLGNEERQEACADWL